MGIELLSKLALGIGGAIAEDQILIDKLRALIRLTFTELGRKEDEAHEFRVRPVGKQDLRAAIAKTMVEAGFGVIGLRFAELTLEDIFLDLIAKEEKKA